MEWGTSVVLQECGALMDWQGREAVGIGHHGETRKGQILLIQGEVEAGNREGHACGQDWIPVEFRASEPSCLLVLQSMDINKGD